MKKHILAEFVAFNISMCNEKQQETQTLHNF